MMRKERVYRERTQAAKMKIGTKTRPPCACVRGVWGCGVSRGLLCAWAELEGMAGDHWGERRAWATAQGREKMPAPRMALMVVATASPSERPPDTGDCPEGKQ